MAREDQSTSGTTSSDKDRGRGETTLANRTHEIADEVRQATVGRVESMRESAQSAKDTASERVRKLGETVRKVGEHLRVEDQNYIADKANVASQRLDDFAGYVRSAEIATLLRDTSNIAKRNPALFFGGSFLLGLAAGRFLKDSGGSSREYDYEPASRVQRLPSESTSSASQASRSTAAAARSGSR